MKRGIPGLFVVVLLLCGSCAGTRFLAEGEKLYTGAQIKFIKEGDVPKTKLLKTEVTKVIAPKPNGTFLGISRPKVWFYGVAGTPKGKGFRYWIKNSLGEPPVLMTKVSPEKTSSLIANRLESNGYFRSKVEYAVKEKKKTASVVYTATLHTPYRIDSINFPSFADTLSTKILKTKDQSFIHTGDIYNLVRLKAERERIDLALKNQGYFYFNPDYLVFYADTASGNHRVNLILDIKAETPLKALERYRIGDVIIDPNYSLMNDSTKPYADTLVIRGKYYINSDSTFNPKNIIKSVTFDHGDYYSRKDHDITLHRLMGLGLFKFVNIKFEDESKTDTLFINPLIYLTPLYKKSLRAEILAISKSTNYSGPGIDISFRNRNFFRGSELFVLSGQAGFETQISGRQANQPYLGSFTLGGSAKLYVPKLLLPVFRPHHISGYFIPKTKFELSAERIYHLQYFTLNTFNFAFGYHWKQTTIREHEYDPIVINYSQLTNTTELFDSVLDNNPFLRKSFEQQFIMGMLYSYTFNNQVLTLKRNQYYFKGTIDLAGNLVSVLDGLFTGVKVNSEDPHELFGSPYSQYARFDFDARYFRVFPQQNKIATRLIMGVGLPYGNSSAMPYIKEFFIGGSNSIRAFRARTLGPGAYPPPPEDSITFLEQAGDMKLEVNGEYRFNLVSIIKGAVFVDAGNIWLLKEDTLRPGGVFKANTFLSQMAVGAGFGIRADASFFVIRADIAFPVRKPWLPAPDRWVFSEIFKPSLTSNLVLNIAIGYPF